MAVRAMGFVMPQAILIGRLIGANLNTTADQAITVRFPGSKWATPGHTTATANCGLFTNVSGSAALAVGGLYTGAGKTGNQLVAATQAYSGLTAAADLVRGVAAGNAVTQVYTTATVYLSLSTAAGVACTCDVYIFATVFP